MSSDIHTKKENLRAEAKRARGLLSLNQEQQDNICQLFLNSIEIKKGDVVAAYWPKGRELDTQILIDTLIDKDINVVLPVVQKDSRLMKFARYTHDVNMIEGPYGIGQPEINDKTQWLEPDIFIVPLLAFDRKGARLGYGGGYYDATLSEYKKTKDIICVGLGYAKQACLFNLPTEEHDIKMNWVITEQDAHKF